MDNKSREHLPIGDNLQSPELVKRQRTSSVKNFAGRRKGVKNFAGRRKGVKIFAGRRKGVKIFADLSPIVYVRASLSLMRKEDRVKRLTKMSEKVATGILSGVVKVSGFFTSSIVNSAVGKKFFSLLPGEIVLASLDGFNKVCEAVEVSGRNVMSTSSVVTTGLVSHRYGEEAGKATNAGLDAAGHAIGTAWAVFKIRKAFNPKSVIKPTTLVKAAARANSGELKAKKK